MPQELQTTMDSTSLTTTIGLEIHVQLKTKSKMFCRCDNNAEGKAPNTVVCPVCLGLPGALPVANRQAIEWTIKTGLAIDSTIPNIAKFDRKHYFYPDLPKGYQISQYDEPFCVGGEIEISGQAIRFNRIHLEEDAGKLIHSGGRSLVDLNRAGTPLMEMVTEPDLTSPKQAGDFLRRLQKLVRDEVKVSNADMEKGHMRCDANISITDGENMSEIVEIKNLNSFKFVEKALALEEERLKAEYPNWKKGKVTRGYDSKANKTFVQREKEEAADYRYFPEPDLPPIDTTKFDLVAMQADIDGPSEEKIEQLVLSGVALSDAEAIVRDRQKWCHFNAIALKSHQMQPEIHRQFVGMLAKSLVNKYFGFELSESEYKNIDQYVKLINMLSDGKIGKGEFTRLAGLIRAGETLPEMGGESKLSVAELEKVVEVILTQNTAELARYKAGEKQLAGFFMGQIIKSSGGKLDAKKANEVLKKKLDGNA